MTNGDILEGQWPWMIVVNPEGCDGIRGSRRRQRMRLHQTTRRRQSIVVVPRQQLHIALKMHNVGLLCWRASSTRLQPRHQEARWQRWAVAGVVAGIVNENGASQHRPIRRQPSASASRPWAATSDEALQAPKTTSTCTPTNPQPPKGSQPKEKKGHQERNALHGIVCPDQRPPAKIKELAAFSDPTSSFFLSTMHAAAVADCCSCPLNSPLEPSHRACCSLPRRHRLHPVAINIDIVSSSRPDDDDRLTLWFFRPSAMK